MKYKTIMLSLTGYTKLAHAKKVFSERAGSEMSFNEFVSDTLCNKIDFLEMDEKLRSYIIEFADRVNSLDAVCGVLLFGSVAKGEYSENSDIDILVVMRPGAKEILAKIMTIALEMRKEGLTLMAANLPSLIDPVVVSESDIAEFRPFYFDIADYGVILHEKERTLTDMTSAFKKRKHNRQKVDGMEVLTWE